MATRKETEEIKPIVLGTDAPVAGGRAGRREWSDIHMVYYRLINNC
jgi:hypothetical protein